MFGWFDTREFDLPRFKGNLDVPVSSVSGSVQRFIRRYYDSYPRLSGKFWKVVVTERAAYLLKDPRVKMEKWVMTMDFGVLHPRRNCVINRILTFTNDGYCIDDRSYHRPMLKSSDAGIRLYFNIGE